MCVCTRVFSAMIAFDQITTKNLMRKLLSRKTLSLIHVLLLVSFTLHGDGCGCWVHSTAQYSSTCVCPSIRGWQWVKCQYARATTCHYSRCDHVVHRTHQPDDGWLISWPSHSNSTLQTVALPSSGSTRRSDGGDSDSFLSCEGAVDSILIEQMNDMFY